MRQGQNPEQTFAYVIKSDEDRSTFSRLQSIWSTRELDTTEEATCHAWKRHMKDKGQQASRGWTQDEPPQPGLAGTAAVTP